MYRGFRLYFHINNNIVNIIIIIIQSMLAEVAGGVEKQQTTENGMQKINNKQFHASCYLFGK